MRRKRRTAATDRLIPERKTTSKKLREKTLEAVSSVLPISLLVLALSLVFVPIDLSTMSLFLFGAKPGVAEKAAENLKSQYPGIVIAGCEDGYHTDDPSVFAHINEAAPDLLLVCLGAPKQERWMAESGASAGLMAGLGGSLDVFAGVVKRAPEAWCRLGLEWLYRLLSDPRRLGRMMKLPLFLFKVIGQRIRGR